MSYIPTTPPTPPTLVLPIPVLSDSLKTRRLGNLNRTSQANFENSLIFCPHDNNNKEYKADKADNANQEEEEVATAAVRHTLRFALLHLLENGSTGALHPLVAETEGSLTLEGGNTLGSRQWVDEDSNHFQNIFVDNILVDLIHCSVRWIIMTNGDHKCRICDGSSIDTEPSRSGTMVDGVPISNVAYTELHVGQIITLGNSTCEASCMTTDQDLLSTGSTCTSFGPILPRFKLINMTELYDQTTTSSKNVYCELMAIQQMSTLAQRLSCDPRDQQHLLEFQEMMEKMKIAFTCGTCISSE
jgi:hypothetical protein